MNDMHAWVPRNLKLMALSEEKLAMVAQIFAVAPNDAVTRLETVLSQARGADPTLQPVFIAASKEAELRRAMSATFSPLLPLTRASGAKGHCLITLRELRQAWLALAAGDPGLAECAVFAVRSWTTEEEPPHELDIACNRAAELVQSESVRRLLRLAPVLRALQPRLAVCTRTAAGEAAAIIRLAFKDALAIDEDAGLLFWESVMAMLEEPWQVLRMISIAIDRPSDRFLADSELAPIGERLLADIEKRLTDLRRFDADGGPPAGSAAAASIQVIVSEIGEFEQWLNLARDGVWGSRIATFKAAAATLMETRYRETEPAVSAAIPTHVRGMAKTTRPAPKMTEEPQPRLIEKAGAYLTLLEESRGAAATGGFASARAKMIETLERRIFQYCEDLLDMLNHETAENPHRVRAYLEIGAGFYERIKGFEAAQIIRRRIASAA
jgi:hypothetical protein